MAHAGQFVFRGFDKLERAGLLSVIRLFIRSVLRLVDLVEIKEGLDVVAVGKTAFPFFLGQPPRSPRRANPVCS